MITLQLAQHRKARVWLDDLPDARVNSVNLAENFVQGGKVAFDGVRRAAIEILMPHGPRALYGLLGAELRPKQSGSLAIRVVISDEAGKPFADSIARGLDEARVGLPIQFSKAVFEGAADQITRIGGLCPGEIVFDYAVHGFVGSAPVVFKWLAACLVQIFRQCENVSQQQIADILQTPL